MQRGAFCCHYDGEFDSHLICRKKTDLALQKLLPDLLLVASLEILFLALFAPGSGVVSRSHLHLSSPGIAASVSAISHSIAGQSDKSRNIRAAGEENVSERNTLVPHGLVSDSVARGLHISLSLYSQLQRSVRHRRMG